MGVSEYEAWVSDMLENWKLSMEDALGRLEGVKQRIADGYPPDTGLCSAVGGGKVLATCWPSWGEYTGDAYYPVPRPAGFVLPERYEGRTEYGPRAAYNGALSAHMYTGEYGASRMRLLEHCISTLTERLENPVTTLWGAWRGCLVSGEWQDREGFTKGKLYELRPLAPGNVPRFSLLDDSSDARLRKWDDFLVLQ